MKNHYEIKLKNIPSDHQHDVFTLSFDAQGTPLSPPDNFIISRNIDNSALSRYQDDTWDMTPYNSTSGKSRLNFRINKTEKLSENHIQQIKWLILCLMYLCPSTLSTSTIESFLKTLRDIAVYCHENNILNISDILSKYTELKKYLMEQSLSTKNTICLFQIMSHLSKAGQKITGISITADPRTFELHAHAEKVRVECIAQTLPIPSRIYLLRIEQLNTLINEFLAHKKGIISLFKACLNDAHYGLAKPTQKTLGRGKTQRKSKLTGNTCLAMLPDFAEALSAHGLTELAQTYNFHSRQSFSAFLTRIRYACKHQIHLYSGMRHDEVKLLRVGCLVRESMIWGEAIFIKGITTKMPKARKPTRWVTCEAVESAIEIAESIAKVIAKHLGHASKDCSLFIYHSNLSTKSVAPNTDDCIKFDLTKYNPSSIMVEQSDINEIERILLNVNWKRYPDVKVGKPWPFKFHQYRRSLAIYGANSGLIELPSLKYQLKHLTNSMTMYYSNGSQRSVDILGACPSTHFIHEYQQQKPISDAILYIRDYLMSDEPLSGGQGITLDRYRASKDSNIILEEREQTERRFKDGEIAYKETPLGACINTEKCDSRLNIVFTSCIICTHAILKPSKVNKFINELQINMKNLQPDSVEYRLEKAQLDDLKRLQAKIKRSHKKAVS